MKCNGCGEDYHGAASCQANLRWLLDRAREEIVCLKLERDSVRVREPAVFHVEQREKPSRSEQMKAIWAKRREQKERVA